MASVLVLDTSQPSSSGGYGRWLDSAYAMISMATLQRANSDATAVAFVANVSGSWTRVTVASGLSAGIAISPASLSSYDGKPMLAYLKHGRMVHARGLTSTGSFTHETAAHTDLDELVQPSVAIKGGRPMIAWAQADGTHYAYQNAYGWYSSRVMPGRTRALLVFDSNGNAQIAAADYAGGLWLGFKNGSTWVTQQLDTHIVSDLGGIAFGGGSVMMEIAYQRGEGRTHLYSVRSITAC